MSAQHTPGLLVVRGYSIYTADGIPVADTCLTTSHPDNDHVNALRLAACWNACEGISTEDLEARHFKSVEIDRVKTQKSGGIESSTYSVQHLPSDDTEGGAA